MSVLVNNFETYLLTQRRVAQNTFAAYKRDIAQYVAFLKEKSIDLSNANTENIRLFLQYLHENQVAARSLARKISSLKLFYNYLVENHGFQNHARDLIMPKLEKKLPRYLTEQEVEVLLAATEHNKTDVGIRNRTMIYLLYVSGMRISELVTLKKDAVHFDTGFISVNGKGGKQRQVPLPQPMLALLKEYLEVIHPRLVMKDGILIETDYLFPIFYGQKIKHISRQAFWIVLKKVAELAQLKEQVSPHTLRHSLATHLLHKGADLRSLQSLLGHEQLSTVQIYTHLGSDELRKVYDKKHSRA